MTVNNPVHQIKACKYCKVAGPGRTGTHDDEIGCEEQIFHNS